MDLSTWRSVPWCFYHFRVLLADIVPHPVLLEHLMSDCIVEQNRLVKLDNAQIDIFLTTL